MPYVKPRERPCARLRKLLLGEEMSASRLADILGCSVGTARSRLEHPEKLTVGELDKIVKKGHISADEIRAAIL